MQVAFARQNVTLFLGCSSCDQAPAIASVRTMLASGVKALALVKEAPRPELFEEQRLAMMGQGL
jgi:LacI family transcriptional regulator